MWQVTLPGENALLFTYNSTSTIGTTFTNANVRTMLTDLIHDEYIESTLELTLLRGIALNQTKVECLSQELDDDSVYVDVNSAGESNL